MIKYNNFIKYKNVRWFPRRRLLELPLKEFTQGIKHPVFTHIFIYRYNLERIKADSRLNFPFTEDEKYKHIKTRKENGIYITNQELQYNYILFLKEHRDSFPVSKVIHDEYILTIYFRERISFMILILNVSLLSKTWFF